MEITTKTIDEVTVIAISGELDGKTAPIVLAQLTPICQPGSKIILDMGRVTYLSSAGLRIMLMLYRQVVVMNGQMILIELSSDLIDTLSETGFLAYFTTRDTLAEGLAVFEQESGEKNDNLSDQIRSYRSAPNPYVR